MRKLGFSEDLFAFKCAKVKEMKANFDLCGFSLEGEFGSPFRLKKKKQMRI